MGEMKNAYGTSVKKPEGKRSLERFRHSWEDNIKWILKKQGVRTWSEFVWSRLGTSGRLL
jgi:hypothetical protein